MCYLSLDTISVPFMFLNYVKTIASDDCRHFCIFILFDIVPSHLWIVEFIA